MREQLHRQLQDCPDPTTLRKRLRDLEKVHPELALPRQLEELQELALRVVIEGLSPTTLKKALKKAPPELADGLQRLESLLSRLEPRKEPCLNAAGQVQQPSASPVGPLWIAVLEGLSREARGLWPEAPSPGEASSWFWPVKSAPAGGPPLEALGEHLARLSRLDQLVVSTNSKIKLIDRINIFTDSPEEARLKGHKAERQSVEAGWKEARRDYHDQAAAERGQQEAGFLSDRLVSLLQALAQVTTERGKSNWPKECPLLHGDSLIPDCDWLLEQQSRRHDLSGDYESLIERVCAAKPGEASFPERLKAHLGDALNAAVKAAQLAASEHREAGEFTATEEKKVTLLDKVNIFTDSPREKAAKEARRVQTELAAAAQRAQENIRTVLMQGLADFPAANLYYMCVELRELCGSIRAVCRSQTYTTGSGSSRRTKTRYYCEIHGVEAAARQATLCAATFHQYHGQVHGLYRQLTRQRMHQVREPSLLDVIRRLYG